MTHPNTHSNTQVTNIPPVIQSANTVINPLPGHATVTVVQPPAPSHITGPTSVPTHNVPTTPPAPPVVVQPEHVINPLHPTSNT